MCHIHRSFLRAPLLYSCLLLLMGLSSIGAAKSMNGNDFALYFSEAKTDTERRTLFDEAKGNPHFFRYLQIMEMEELQQDGRSVIQITAFEPASLMDVKFTVAGSLSQKIIKEDPASLPGDALALTGKVAGVDLKKNEIQLASVIIRHKDRLSPAVGQELLCEVSASSVFYSFTGGTRTVQLTYKDRDLLQYKRRVMAQSGREGWALFLEQELAKRKRERAAAEKAKQP